MAMANCFNRAFASMPPSRSATSSPLPGKPPAARQPKAEARSADKQPSAGKAAQPSERATAARRLCRVLGRGDSLDNVLRRTESPFCLELIHGCLRHYFSLAAALDALLEHPLRTKDLDVYCLLLVGAYQLQRMGTPAHAAVNETVAAVRPLGKPWAAGLVNGVLRRLPPTPEAMDEHPSWLRQKIQEQHPRQAMALLAANNDRAPMSLRVNRSRIAPEQFQQALRRAGLGFAVAWLSESIILDKPQPAETLPGFAQGWFSVQDCGAQLVGDLARRQLRHGSRVLDACAAPGGKLFHLLESQLELEAVALDASSKRLAVLEKIAQRLGHRQFKAIAADATSWNCRQPFDLVLVDAPCSGTGTLRRNPDIKVTRTPAQVAQAAALQGRLLQNLWRMVRPSGNLLYCTCSMLAEENDQVIKTFLQANADALPRRIALPSGQATQHGWQMLPTDRATDGFYTALIAKQP